MTTADKIKTTATNIYLKHREQLKQKEIEFYKGKGVFCPVCEMEFRSFAPWYGKSITENARCPNCESMERQRLLWLYLQEKIDFINEQKKKLLHFAPERCFFDYFSNLPFLDYTPCDINPDKYEINYQGKLTKADITNLPFSDHCFDVILCYHILEHIPDDKKAMSELYRVMKKGGWGIFQVPVDYTRVETYEDFSITTPEEKERVFGQEDHVRLYGRDYPKKLENAGFTVKEDTYAAELSPELALKYGIKQDERIYFCSKK
jgi:SAM-dependent methyltransferase